MKRGIILVYCCGAPLLAALWHINVVKMIGPMLRRSLPYGLHPMTAAVYDRPAIGVGILLLTTLMNAVILFIAWRRSKEAIRASRLETSACLLAGIAIMAWIFGMLFVTFRSFLLPPNWHLNPNA